MAGSQQYRLRLPLPLAQQVQTMAELWGVPFAAVLRLAVEDLMTHPDRAHELLGKRYGAMEDSSTPAQREAATQYLAHLAQVDLAELLADHHPPLPY